MMNSQGITRVRRTGSKRRRATRACAGFSIVELIIVMGVIMIVSGMAVPALQDAIKSAKTARAVSDVRTIGDAALGYSAEYGTAPSSLVDIWYEKQVDPWGHLYSYRVITDATDPALLRKDRFGVPVNKYFDLYSLGPDGLTSIQFTDPQAQDDVVWAADGVYMGVAENY